VKPKSNLTMQYSWRLLHFIELLISTVPIIYIWKKVTIAPSAVLRNANYIKYYFLYSVYHVVFPFARIEVALQSKKWVFVFQVGHQRNNMYRRMECADRPNCFKYRHSVAAHSSVKHTWGRSRIQYRCLVNAILSTRL
jgi:hypothetical protein